MYLVYILLESKIFFHFNKCKGSHLHFNIWNCVWFLLCLCKNAVLNSMPQIWQGFKTPTSRYFLFQNAITLLHKGQSYWSFLQNQDRDFSDVTLDSEGETKNKAHKNGLHIRQSLKDSTKRRIIYFRLHSKERTKLHKTFILESESLIIKELISLSSFLSP